MKGIAGTVKRRRIVAIAGLIAGVAALLYLAVPSAAITPGDSQAQVITGQTLKIDSSPTATISMLAVYVDGQQALLEYNLGSGELDRDLDLKPGQQVRVETTISSVIGVHRQFTSSFTTVDPLFVSEVLLDGSAVKSGGRIPPQAELVFAFNKPVTEASVTLDSGDTYLLEIDPEDPTRARLQPMSYLRQGAPCIFRVSATATDSSAIGEPQEIRTMVVKPLNLYGRAQAGDDGTVTVELTANVPFTDVDAVRQALATNIPDASIVVEPQKIIVTAAGLSGGEHTITINNAQGEDGSLLEGPLTLTLAYSAGQASMTGSNSSYVYRGYSYNSEEVVTQQPSGSPADSGPPPGWPSCCPWPPQ